MANFVRCRLSVEGGEEIIREMAAAVRGVGEDGETNYFSLQRILPMPRELDIPAGSPTDDGILYLSYRCQGWPHDFSEGERRRIETIGRWEQTSPEHFRKCVDNGLRAFSNTARYGYPTWREWRIARWGTKWDTWDTSYDGERTFMFTAAWSAPLEAVLELSIQYPDLVFTIDYADEDASHNCGTVRLASGGCQMRNLPRGGSPEAWEKYFELWPECRGLCDSGEERRDADD